MISLGKGVRLLTTLQAVSEADDKGMRTVMVTLNGQQRQVEVRDRSVKSNVHEAEKADTSNTGHVPAPFSGTVTVVVEENTTVEAGDTIATIEAMKMEAGITAPISGTVSRVVLKNPTPVEGNDLILVLDPA